MSVSIQRRAHRYLPSLAVASRQPADADDIAEVAWRRAHMFPRPPHATPPLTLRRHPHGQMSRHVKTEAEIDSRRLARPADAGHRIVACRSATHERRAFLGPGRSLTEVFTALAAGLRAGRRFNGLPSHHSQHREGLPAPARSVPRRSVI
jgi:hypothetical protein